MCVLNKLCQPAIAYYETYLYAVLLHILSQKAASGKHRSSQKTQEPVIKTIYYVQEEMKPTLLAVRDEEGLEKFDLMLTENVQRLKKMQEEYSLSISSRQKDEILEKQRVICVKIITRSFLRHEVKNNELIERKDEVKRPTVLLEDYVKVACNALKYFEKQVKSGAEKDENIKMVKALLDSNSDKLLRIESYSEKLKKCKPYEGFDIYTTGEWENRVLDDEGKVIFSQELPILCLEGKGPNSYYPYDFMVVCIDLEMESGGKTEDEAYENLSASFALLFRSMFEKDETPGTVIKALEGEKARETVWKDTFHELLRIGRDQKVKKRDCEDIYRWNPTSGVTHVRFDHKRV